jgi:hypothetical protein
MGGRKMQILKSANKDFGKKLFNGWCGVGIIYLNIIISTFISYNKGVITDLLGHQAHMNVTSLYHSCKTERIAFGSLMLQIF